MEVPFLKSCRKTDAVKLNTECRKFDQSINGHIRMCTIVELKQEIKMHCKEDIKQ